MNTRLRLRRVEQIFSLPILLPHSVVGLHRNGAKRMPVGRHAIAETEIVDAVGKNRKACQNKDRREESAPQSRRQCILRDEHV